MATIQKAESAQNQVLGAESLKLRKSAIKAYETDLKEGDDPKAAEIAKKFELGEEKATAAATVPYNKKTTDRSFVETALADKKQVAELVPEMVKERIVKALPFALEIWDDVMSIIKEVEQESRLPIRMDYDKKFYALDPILISEALDIDQKKIRPILTLFTLYYLQVHMMDDLVEDQKKFYSKFKNIGCDSEHSFMAAATFFPLSFNLCAAKLLKRSEITDESALKTINLLNKGLFDHVRNLALEKSDTDPEKILRIKQHGVSGESTSVFADLLKVSIDLDIEQHACLKKALFYLGALTQFTDDIRDYKEDMANSNANLLISINKVHGSKGTKVFAGLYETDAMLMDKWLTRLGVPVDIELLRALPWHPFIAKPLITVRKCP